ncbi:MAG: hemerythrin domain-containing protein [Deltaproteobacteria bacterium]|nr:hemerythrin domain-containing protein [Deltaproteobacteria bacterium]
MSTSTITQYYEKDHDRLDGLFKTFQRLKKSDFKKAKEAFVAFKFGLQRHIIWEEEILFPIFEEKGGVSRDSGPTAVMRIEHRQIGQALEAVHQGVSRGSTETDSAENQLISVLKQHNLKEESILYPAIDNFLCDEERGGVFHKMENLPPERYEKCC